MRTKFCFWLTVLTLIALQAFNSRLSTAWAQGTVFTYQGRLDDGGSPANGTNYGMVFYLYDASSGGNLLGNEGIVSVTISNGLFTVPLNFGSVFDGNSRWLEISVQKNGGGFTTLTPRQPITPTPYAIYAEGANAANLSGAIADTNLSPNVALLNGNQTFTRQNNFNTNVGIGTTSPGQLLQVGDGSVAGSQGMIRLGSHTPNPTGTAARTWEFGVPQTGDISSGIGYSFVINDVSQGATDFMIKWGSGNVGIGTTNPSTALQVNGTVTATALSGDGSALVNLDASQVSSGTLLDARLSTNVALLGAQNQSFTGTNRFIWPLLIGTNEIAASSENSGDRIVSGIVNADGSIASGTNFAVQNLGSGQYLVQFYKNFPSSAFAAAPAVTVTVQANPVAPGSSFSYYTSQITSQSASFFIMQLVRYDVTPNYTPYGATSVIQANPVTNAFNFIAIGPRGPGSFNFSP